MDIYKVRWNFVTIYRRRSDEHNSYIYDRDVVGSPSVYTDEIPTITTDMYIIGMSSKFRQYILTDTIFSESCQNFLMTFRRFCIFDIRRYVVGISSITSDDFLSVGRSVGIYRVFL